MCSFTPRFNGDSDEFPVNCRCQIAAQACNCSPLTTNNDGVYSIHITVNTGVVTSSPQWCSNNVTIIVQSKAQNSMQLVI